MAKRTDIKFHRDGTITVWDAYDQSWRRLGADNVSNRLLSTFNDYERSRIARHRASRTRRSR